MVFSSKNFKIKHICLDLSYNQFFKSNKFLENIIIRMNPFRIVKNIVHNSDFFSTTQLIRYKQDPDYKTLTGGIFSLIIVGVIASIFFSMAVQAINRDNIIWSSQIIKQSQPGLLKIPCNMHNVAVNIQGLNLSDTTQYFDVTMTMFYFYNKTLNSQVRIPLQACRRDDWAMDQDILGNFDRMHGQNWLCPQKNSSFNLMGKFTSQNYGYVQIDVKKCGSVNVNATCADAALIDLKIKNIVYFSIFYVNTLITPDAIQPISYYLEDKDYIAFGSTLGAYGYIFWSDYSIVTDYSLLPLQQQVAISGGVVQIPTTISVQQVTNDWYASFCLRKSTNRYEYSRSFTKFDYVVSYTGGLFGAIIGILFLMNHYTRLSFEIVLGSSIYNDENGQPIRVKSLNFFRYIGFTFYKLLNSLGCSWKSKNFQNYQNCRSEVQKNLDIRFILQKLIFLQRSLNTICGQDKYKTLHLKSKCTLQQAKKYRELYFLKSTIINSISSKYKNLDDKSQSASNNDKQNSKQILKVQTILTKKIGQRISQRIRNGKVYPIQIISHIEENNKEYSDSVRPLQPIEQEFESSGKDNEVNIDRQKAIKERLQCIQQNNSKCSSDFPSNMEYKIDEDIIKSLQTVKKAADKGDLMSIGLWQSINSDIRTIIEECIYQRNNLNEVKYYGFPNNKQN